MITTGSPAASLCATRGNDPTERGAPFGGKQGTRLKISPADFATCLTFSTALSVRLFCCGWVALTDGLPPSCLVSGLAVSAIAACCAVSARAICGVEVSSAKAAVATHHVVAQKGRRLLHSIINEKLSRFF